MASVQLDASPVEDVISDAEVTGKELPAQAVAQPAPPPPPLAEPIKPVVDIDDDEDDEENKDAYDDEEKDVEVYYSPFVDREEEPFRSSYSGEPDHHAFGEFNEDDDDDDDDYAGDDDRV